MDNLKALHAAREAFIQAESSARIRRALNSNVRSYSDVSYLPGHKVYYHRQGALEWRGPASVLGKDGQIVLLKHGGYFRVHPCRLTLVPKSGMEVSSSSSALDTVPFQPPPPLKSSLVYDADDSLDQVPEQQFDQAPTSSPVAEVQTPLILGIHAPVTNETPPPVGRTGPIIESSPFSVGRTDPISETPPLSVDHTNSISETSVCQLRTHKLAPGDLIKITNKDSSTNILKIHSRSGKATGIHAHSWNVTDASGIHCNRCYNNKP